MHPADTHFKRMNGLMAIIASCNHCKFSMSFGKDVLVKWAEDGGCAKETNNVGV